METNANGLTFDSDGNEILSDTPIPPGEHLEEGIEYIGMTERELADKMGMSEQEVGELIRGEMAVTQDIADSLELILGVPAHMWVNLEARYQRTLAKKREREEEARRVEGVPVGSRRV